MTAPFRGQPAPFLGGEWLLCARYFVLSPYSFVGFDLQFTPP